MHRKKIFAPKMLKNLRFIMLHLNLLKCIFILKKCINLAFISITSSDKDFLKFVYRKTLGQLRRL